MPALKSKQHVRCIGCTAQHRWSNAQCRSSMDWAMTRYKQAGIAAPGKSSTPSITLIIVS